MQINPQDPKYAAAFARLLGIMNDLREKCPWDMKQTMESIRHLSIEEVYELSDAILDNNIAEVKKELGDLMLHIVFYSKIAAEQQAFDVADVLHGVCDKLIARHPHIYGDVQVSSEEEVMKNWQMLKLKEKDGNKTVLGGVPKSLPALVKAQRIQEKASGVGFDWDNGEQVWAKVLEELAEFKEAEAEAQQQQEAFHKMEEEFGDLFFALVNYARFAGINPETALERTNKKFISRFGYLEQAIKNAGKQFGALSLAEMDVYWEEAKKLEKQ
jgi:XTP/dITP diphosphohydrolase